MSSRELPKKYRLDKTLVQSYNMEAQGNIDKNYWRDRTAAERLEAAVLMIEAAFECDYYALRLDKQIIRTRKHEQ